MKNIIEQFTTTYPRTKYLTLKYFKDDDWRLYTGTSRIPRL